VGQIRNSEPDKFMGKPIVPVPGDGPEGVAFGDFREWGDPEGANDSRDS